MINPCNFLRDKEAEVHGGNVKETQVTAAKVGPDPIFPDSQF